MSLETAGLSDPHITMVQLDEPMSPDTAFLTTHLLGRAFCPGAQPSVSYASAPHDWAASRAGALSWGIFGLREAVGHRLVMGCHPVQPLCRDPDSPATLPLGFPGIAIA